MKSLQEYLTESLFKNKNNNAPKTKEELQDIIKQRIKEDGDEVDLNDIDVSNITDMSNLFYRHKNFNGDISKWDVSNVTNMKYMFYDCELFNQDISGWDVSNVTNMTSMFCNCKNFNQDISTWDVSNVRDNDDMFYACKIEEKYKPHFK